MIPRATYRLQFHKGFTFADGMAQADYFAALGISHIYASPILTARAGSLHGYDVVDHAHVNPELGGEAGLRALAAALKARGLGLIVDIVPNHMAVGKADNPWWLDLLANGPASRHARTFDIDWDAPGLENRILAPFLDGEPEDLLARGDLKLVQEAGLGWSFAYFDHRFPLRPEDQGNPRGVPLADLLARQHFVLADWRQADARINWRRFFDITDLGAIRIAEPAVFEAVHGKIFALYAEGLIDGVRVDHVDGIADPGDYCRLLRQRLAAYGREPYVIVEKILAEDEGLPPGWDTDGTTGYDFMDEVCALLHDEDGGALDGLWRRYGTGRDFETEEADARRQILTTRFAAQLAATARAFARLLTVPEELVAVALVEIIVQLRCYRSYATGMADTPGPGPHMTAAITHAAQAQPDKAPTIHAIAALFSRRDGDPLTVDALRRFHQLSAPVAAKAVEDTAMYRYGRLLSRNDVGFDARTHKLDIAAFHARMERRARDWPHTMLTTATHDHKRGEDTRARLAVLGVEHAAWAGLAATVLARAPEVLAAGDVYQLLQSLVGAWPEAPQEDFGERIANWARKYLREAKLRSSWNAPDTSYEDVFCNFAIALAQAPASSEVGRALTDFVSRISDRGRANGLVQTVLRYTLPGMPDLYQGCEFPDHSFVDPDNRRPVDYAARRAALAQGPSPKLAYIQALCALRNADPDFWRHAIYRPVEAQDNSSAIAFMREHAGKRVLVIGQCHSRNDVRGRLTETLAGLRNLLSGAPADDVAIASLLAGQPVSVFAA